MLKSIQKFIFCMVISVLQISISNTFAQSEEIGVLFSKEEALSRFGPIVESAEINTENLVTILLNCQNYVMFKLQDGQIYILGDNRSVLYPQGGTVSDSDVFHLFSKSKVDRLLDAGKESVTFVERRNTVLTVTNGTTTLEVSAPCPPYCK